MPTYATVVGNLARDPEQKPAGSGTVTEFTVASNHGFGDRQTTTWIRVSIWGKSGDAAMQHLSKGKGVIANGQLHVRTFDKKDGTKGYSVELDRADWTFAPGGKSDGAPRSQSGGGNTYGGSQGQQGQQGQPYGNDEGIPF